MEKEKKDFAVRNGGVSEEMINAWKAKHRKVFAVEVVDDDTKEVFVGYFAHPDKETLSLVNKIAKADEIKSAETMFNRCWLGGDELLKTDPAMNLSATGQLQGIFTSYSATLKNL